MGGVNNRIANNTIEDNASNDGIAISRVLASAVSVGAVATDNQIVGNTIQNNGRYGILIKDATSVRNQISQNSITGNQVYGIKIDAGAQASILPPTIISIQSGHMVGTAQPGATVEIYSDPAGQGKVYLNSTMANGGNWTFDLPRGQNSSLVTALQTDVNHNSSAFFTTLIGTAHYTVTAPINGQTTITVTGTGGGVAVTLANINQGIGAFNTTTLLHCGSGRVVEQPGWWRVATECEPGNWFKRHSESRRASWF